jgi:hypothetical protein
MGNMGDKQGHCLAPSEILAYLRVDLPEGQEAVVDRHLDECRLCGGAVEGVARLEWREDFLRSTDSLLLRIRTRRERR